MNRTCAVLCAVTQIGCADVAVSTDEMEQSSLREDSSVDRKKLCDGVAELKLRIFYAPQNEREPRGSVVRVENGAPSFGVDGQCHYFMSGGWDQASDVHNSPWREGQLDDETAHAMEAAMPLTDLSSIADCQSMAGFFDISPLVITTASSHAACVAPGHRFEAASDAFYSRIAALWENAEPMKGALWISATEGGPASPTPRYDWPLDEPLTSYFIGLPQPGMSSDFKSGEGHAITDPDDVEKLRALRKMFLDDQAAMTTAREHAPIVRDGKREGFLYLRDALPYEDDHGLLTWEAPTDGA